MGIFDFFSSTPSPAKFANIVIKSIASKGHDEVLRYDAEQFRLVSEADSGRVFNLNNAYRDYCAAEKKDRPALLDKYFQGLFVADMPASFEQARPKLLPILRSRALVEYLRLRETGDDDSRLVPASAPFSTDTVLMLAYDTEHSMMTLTRSHLADWGVTFEHALDAARDNLRDITVSSFGEFVPGLYVSDWNDSYDTSRILFPDVVYQADVGSDPVMMIPTRNRFLVAAGNDPRAQIGMVALARQLAEEEGRAVSSLMYRFADGRAVEFVPDNEEVADALGQLHRTYLAEDYAQQKDMLDRYNEKSGVDVFVATYQLYQSEQSGRTASLGVWTENVDTLLPEVDLVVLVASADLEEGAQRVEPKFIKWADLQAVTGEFERVDNGYPVRFRPLNFPDKPRRDSIAAAEI